MDEFYIYIIALVFLLVYLAIEKKYATIKRIYLLKIKKINTYNEIYRFRTKSYDYLDSYNFSFMSECLEHITTIYKECDDEKRKKLLVEFKNRIEECRNAIKQADDILFKDAE